MPATDAFPTAPAATTLRPPYTASAVVAGERRYSKRHGIAAGGNFQAPRRPRTRGPDRGGATGRTVRAAGVESTTRLGRHRWKVERSLAWLLANRHLTVRYERR